MENRLAVMSCKSVYIMHVLFPPGPLQWGANLIPFFVSNSLVYRLRNEPNCYTHFNNLRAPFHQQSQVPVNLPQMAGIGVSQLVISFLDKI